MLFSKANSDSIHQKIRRHRLLWGVVILLVFIGVAVVVRRTAHLVPIIINGYNPPAPSLNSTFKQLIALDDIFARYPVITLLHILFALAYIVLAPVQFSQAFR